MVGKDRVPVVKQVLKGKSPVSALSAAERSAAAAWYRDVAGRVKGAHASAARLYNLARAEYLEGTRASLEASLPEFMKNNGL